MTDSHPSASNTYTATLPEQVETSSAGQAKSWARLGGQLSGVQLLYAGLLLLLIGVIGWLYGHIVDTESLGFTHDDGVYAVVGKSLAQGTGFTLLHVVGHPGQIKYPFVYPAILALVWLVNPHFPQNLPALNYITITFTLAACGLLYTYLRQCHKFPGWLALLVIAMSTSNFFFIYFFSSVMSEAPYLFFSLLTLWVFYRRHQKEPVLSSDSVLLLIALSSVTFLTRVTGIALMAAIGVWLLLNRQWRNAVLYGLGCLALGVFPWMLWVKFNTPPLTAMNFPLVNAYSNYGLEFAHNYTAGSNYLLGVQRDFIGLIHYITEDMIAFIPNVLKIHPELAKQFPSAAVVVGFIALISTYLLFGYFVLQSISTLRKAFFTKQGTKRVFNPTAFSVPSLYLFFYVVIITLWNYEDQMARFLTVVTPLLWLYFFKPMAHLLPDFGKPFPQATKKAWAAMATVLMVAVLTFASAPDTYHTAYTSRNEHWVDSGKYRWMWGEYKQVFAWIRKSLPTEARMAASSDVVFYLYTDRPTFYINFASLRRSNGKFVPASIPLLMQSLDYYHMQYLIAEPHLQGRVVRAPVNIVAQELMDSFPNRFKKIYDSPRKAISIYQILPPKPDKKS